jgi:multimeric flavodoxin WrbA
MKINIYYGGRGLIEDPTLYVISKLTSVLEELRVQVTRYNLYEEKNGISMLPKTLKEADGVILAVSVEWFGIGGLMQQFLDACWLYADKDKLSKLYMLPVAIASTYGERDAELFLIKAWEILGGIPVSGLGAYVEDHVDFETNKDFAEIIEKKAEAYYRTIHQKTKILPTSNAAVKQNLLRSSSIVLTPQESEQLSMYVSDDTYVKKQKEDIEELTQMFKEMLDNNGDGEGSQDFIKNLKDNFHLIDDFSASYCIRCLT